MCESEPAYEHEPNLGSAQTNAQAILSRRVDTASRTRAPPNTLTATLTTAATSNSNTCSNSNSSGSAKNYSEAAGSGKGIGHDTGVNTCAGAVAGAGAGAPVDFHNTLQKLQRSFSFSAQSQSQSQLVEGPKLVNQVSVSFLHGDESDDPGHNAANASAGQLVTGADDGTCSDESAGDDQTDSLDGLLER